MTVIELGCRTVLTNRIARREDLLDADSPVLLHLPAALSSVYCDDVADRLRFLALKPYEASLGSDEFAPIPKLGPALFEYHEEMLVNHDEGLSAYFEQSDKDAALLRDLFDDSHVPDPFHVLQHVAQALLGRPVSVATEGDRPFFSGLVRDIAGGALPHCDDASVDTPDLTVGKTDRQLSLLFYLTDFTGGGLTLYEKKPTTEDNRVRQLGYGYTWAAVQGAAYQGVVPAKGSIVAFNPRFLHSVAPVLGVERRLTFSAFVGRVRSTGQLIFWS